VGLQPFFLTAARRTTIYVVSGWIVLRLLAGFIRRKIVKKRGEGVLLDIMLGIVGSIVGGWLFNTFGTSGVTGLNLYSLLVAGVGSVVPRVVDQASGVRERASQSHDVIVRKPGYSL
jgi:uncharacterized membrane protein YeaQ/YmgE (transglycosylase-associated protein family)